MPRKIATQVDNKFIRGLITDTTALNFPEDAATDAINCVFDHTGRITRRLGLNFEDNLQGLNVSYAANDDLTTEFVWNTSEGVLLKTFFIAQHGSKIEFYDCTDKTTVGQNHKPTFTTDLLSYPLTISYFNPAEYPCQYAVGNNKLIIVNKAINPLLVTYNDETDTISITEIKIKFRDFEGVDDGLGVFTRPTETVSSLKTNNPKHFYNLLNQGWHSGDALTQWDTALTTMPSNADQVSFFRASETDAFDSARVTAYSAVLNTPAPKGHFILEVGNINRTTAMADEGYTGAVIADESVLIPAGSGTVIHNANSNSANAFDSTTSQASASCATWTGVVGSFTFSKYIGKNFGSPSERIGYAKIYASNNNGFINSHAGYVKAALYASNTLPASATDGTLLGQIATSTDSSSLVLNIGSNDSSTAWQYVWVTLIYYSGDSTPRDMYIAEVQFYSSNSSISYHRPQTVAFMAGRAWYAGIEDGTLNNNIYYSRIILKDEDYSKCYQANDPTSEFLSQVLPDDGGVIRILEAGRIKKLFAYQNSILVFASNGIWRISFSSATEYSVRKISSVNIDSALSLVDVRGVPVWWADDGIYTVQYEANFDAFSVTSLVLDKINKFFLNIPRLNRKYVKGTFDADNFIVYWLYNNSKNLTTNNYYIYNSVLVFDTRTQAFYPWRFQKHINVEIRGIFYLQPGSRTVDPKIKYLVNTDRTSNTYSLFFAEVKDTHYLDWYAYVDGNLDYDSYFITGYKLHGEVQRFAQPNYVFVYLDNLENSSCYVQGIYDFTNSGSSGKWSQAQQVYNENLTFRDINFRRLKIRGKGRSIQLKFYSETQKPFSIVGWSMMESQNAGV